MNKKISDYEGFEGPDVDLATSLYEYGMIWKHNEQDGDTMVVYGIDFNDDLWTSFDHGWYASKELFNDYNWVDWDSFYMHEDIMRKDFSLLPHGEQLFYLCNYYGMSEILGECYFGGYKIEED